MSHPDPQSALREFPKAREFFVGIDSDGCVFDTMEVKHKECFIPEFVNHLGLAAVSKMAREVAEFVNLYSADRGINRFPGYLRVLDLLADRPEVARRGFDVPRVEGWREWAARETTLANPALKAQVTSTNHPDLALALKWSEAVNRRIAETVREVPPFPLVRETLETLTPHADVMVVSATPCDALKREWDEHDLSQHVSLIAGQEMGTKREVLAIAAVDRYDRDKILMIGDAPGDLKAARSNGVLFYPIDPGYEVESWERLHDEGIAKFFEGTFAGAYMDEQIRRFERLLPTVPPWR